MGTRHRGRELALQMLYQRELSGASAEQILRTFEDLQAAPDAAREFAERLFLGVSSHMEDIDREVVSNTEHWRIERMAAVDRNILRLALYELIHEPDTPHAVIIDEAVELAKRFGSERSGQFVNGILDGFAQRGRVAGGA